MNVVFDTNVFGAIASPESCADKSVIDDYRKLRLAITANKIVPYISEASLGLEALGCEQRINEFFREWATKSSGIIPSYPCAKRIEIVNKALMLGFKVLRVPRIALGEMVQIEDAAWAKDELFDIKQRQDRTFSFIRNHGSNGLPALKKHGAELARQHNLPIKGHLALVASDDPYQHLWLKGIVAEYDNPRLYNSSKNFVKKVRGILAETWDVDILASVYGYGLELFCTNDQSKGTGTKGVLHFNNLLTLKEKYGIEAVTPSKLLEKIPPTSSSPCPSPVSHPVSLYPRVCRILSSPSPRLTQSSRSLF